MSNDKVFYTTMTVLGLLIVVFIIATFWAIGYQSAMAQGTEAICEALDAKYIQLSGPDLCALPDGTVIDPTVYDVQ